MKMQKQYASEYTISRTLTFVIFAHRMRRNPYTILDLFYAARRAASQSSGRDWRGRYEQISAQANRIKEGAANRQNISGGRL